MKLPYRSVSAFIVVAVVSAACSTQQGRSERSPGSADTPVDTSLPSAPPAPTQPNPPRSAPAPLPPARSYPRNLQDSGASPAAVTLVRQAQEARSAGHADQALALLERALRIEPRNPFIWQVLASTQMDLKAFDQAESAARKSNSVARGNPYAELGNWKLIATARQAGGDSAGAFAAQSQAEAVAARIAAP